MNFKQIELRQEKANELISLEIGLTSKCNFCCRYCCKYSSKEDDFISADTCINVIKKIKNLQRVKLSGGEILLYFDECLKLLKYCKKYSIKTQINTNGSLLDAKKIKILENAGLDILHFSLNFSEPEDFSYYYNLDESVFFKIIENIRISAIQKSLDTIVETIIFKKTENNLLQVHKFIADILNVKKHELQLGIPIKKNGFSDLIDPECLKNIVKNLILNKRSGTELYFSCFKKNMPVGTLRDLEILANEKKGIFFPDCIEGRNQLHLHSNGDILICELGYPEVIGNIFMGTDISLILEHMPAKLKSFLSRHNCIKNYGIAKYPIRKSYIRV